MALVKLLSNLLHNAKTLYKGETHDLPDHLVESLEQRGLVTKNIEPQTPAQPSQPVAPVTPALAPEEGIEDESKTGKVDTTVEEGGSEDKDTQEEKKEDIEEGGSEDESKEEGKTE